jgi:PTS system cellobiose-specific IIB component
MKKLNVLLVCGSGASSGFMAANIRKAAAVKGVEITVNARSESEIENYIDEIDCLMVGPHLNGEMALDHILSLF